jgi:hypothetical protein
MHNQEHHFYTKNFYPTPRDLVNVMVGPYLEDIRNNRRSILDPSAGVGDMLNGVKYHNYSKGWHRDKTRNLYAIEINTEFHPILREKGYRIIGEDFLQFSGSHDFDYIFMNPPFDRGAEHLLKAWDILKDGTIRCLLNAETLANPYTRNRQLLSEIIDEYEGEVEFLGERFVTGVRPTHVEIALVTLTKKAENRFNFLAILRALVS